MFIYQPHIDSTDRTVWYGGESTQLHYQEHSSDHSFWKDQAVRTLGGGIPTGMSELHAELIDFYNYCNAAVI